MSESTYKVQGSRVYKQGEHSYNLNNKHDATKLCETLNHYEEISRLNKNIDKQFDKVTRELIQVKMSLSILTDDINKLAGDIHDLKGVSSDTE